MTSSSYLSTLFQKNTSLIQENRQSIDPSELYDHMENELSLMNYETTLTNLPVIYISKKYIIISCNINNIIYTNPYLYNIKNGYLYTFNNLSYKDIKILVYIWNIYIKGNNVNKLWIINKINKQFYNSPRTCSDAIKLIMELSYYYSIMSPDNCLIITGNNCKIQIVLS